jgi:8-oxo-dGTP diphosphatase
MCDGVHWPSARLMAATSRTDDMLVAASCHTREELAHAGTLAVDFAVLGPVAPTPTHPSAVPLGWDEFSHVAQASRVPVFALGGLTASDLRTAIDAGAHGVALRRGAWN